jgi:hypothetical protein
MRVIIETHSGGGDEILTYDNADRVVKEKFDTTVYGPGNTVLAVVQNSDVKKLVTDLS